MRTIIFLTLLGLFVGCATPDPMVTGNPQDWRGKLAVDLKTAWGEPTRVITAASGEEVWEYSKSKDVMIPKGESSSLSFGFFGAGSSSGGAGGFSSEKRPEDRMGVDEMVCRFKINKGKITELYGERVVNGKTVWKRQ